MIRTSIRVLVHSIAALAITAIAAIANGAHAQPAPDPAAPGAQPALPEPPLGTAPAPQSGMFTPKRWLALGVVGVTAVSAAVFAVEGQRAADAHDAAYELCGDPDVPCKQGDQANVLMAQAHHHARIANIALATGIASIAIAVVLWERGAPDSPSRVAVVPHVAPGEAGLVAAGSF
jgi:peptidoglycan/LPS O-acetylase OafA/YrhL